jgi:hypothetical protein
MLFGAEGTMRATRGSGGADAIGRWSLNGTTAFTIAAAVTTKPLIRIRIWGVGTHDPPWVVGERILNLCESAIRT